MFSSDRSPDAVHLVPGSKDLILGATGYFTDRIAEALWVATNTKVVRKDYTMDTQGEPRKMCAKCGQASWEENSEDVEVEPLSSIEPDHRQKLALGFQTHVAR